MDLQQFHGKQTLRFQNLQSVSVHILLYHVHQACVTTKTDYKIIQFNHTVATITALNNHQFTKVNIIMNISCVID